MSYYIGRVDSDGTITHCLINGLFVRFRGKVSCGDKYVPSTFVSPYFWFRYPKNYDFSYKNLRVFETETNKDVTLEVVDLFYYRKRLLKDIFPEASERSRRILVDQISKDLKEKIYFISDTTSYMSEQIIIKEYDSLNLNLPRSTIIWKKFNAIINSYQIKGIKKLDTKSSVCGISIDSQDAYFELKLKFPFTFGEFYKIDRAILDSLYIKELQNDD